MTTFEVMSLKEISTLINFPDEYLDRDDQYMEALGMLGSAFGIPPSEYFNRPDWNKTILFDIKCAKLYYDQYFDRLQATLTPKQ